jgi:YihY family inner membrane protein
MSARFDGVGRLVRAVVAEVRAAEVTFLAASLAYYTFVSLVPLLVLAVVAATVVGGEALTARVMELTGRYLVPTGQDAVSGALSNQTGAGGVTVVGLAVLLWSSLKIFRGLDTAFSKVYGSAKGSVLEQVRDGVVALVGIGVGVFAVTAAGAAIAALDLPGVQLLAPVVLLATLAAAFLPLYYVFPDADVTVREVLPGTLFAAVGWTVLAAVFGVYAAFSSTGDRALYGVLGGILLLVTWFYLGGLVLLTGAVVNAVLGGRSPDRSGDADAGAAGGRRERRRGRRAARDEEGGDGARAAGFRERPDARDDDGPSDRQLQQPGGRHDRPGMSTDTEAESEGVRDDTDRDAGPGREPRPAADIADLEDRLDEVRADLDAFESDVRERTVDRPALESELKRYVRRRVRSGRARGWGPYLVLLYGTVMTLGAFVYLRGVYAVLAMLVLFLSTLGLYVVFVAVGLGLGVLSVPGRAADAVRDRRG